MLDRNGYRLVTEQTEPEEFAVRVAAERLAIDAVASWLRVYAQEG